jgi:mycothiol synthase
MYTIRPYFPTTEEEYAPLVAVHNAAWPDDLTTIASWFFRDKSWPKDKLRTRFVVESGGQMVTTGAYMETHWADAPDKYGYFYSSMPAVEEDAELHQLVYNFVLDALSDRKPKVFSTDAREDKTFRVRWLESQGFVPGMRFAVSELDIKNFDFSRFAGAQERATSTGVQFVTLADLLARDPNCMMKLYDMLWELEQDVPQPDPPVREPFDEFVKGFDNPNLWPEGWVMAIDPALTSPDDPVGAYVGVSMLAKNPPMPQRVQTWLTGVVRSHRRKGIALAMKLRAIEFAIAHGGTSIRTDNEENNPMLGINKTLGFAEIPAEVAFDKTL